MGTGTNNEIGIRKIQNVRTGTQIGVCLRIRGSTSERHPSTHLPAVCVHDRAARRARVPRAVRHRTLSAVSLVTVGVPPPRSGRHPCSRPVRRHVCRGGAAGGAVPPVSLPHHRTRAPTLKASSGRGGATGVAATARTRLLRGGTVPSAARACRRRWSGPARERWPCRDHRGPCPRGRSRGPRLRCSTPCHRVGAPADAALAPVAGTGVRTWGPEVSARHDGVEGTGGRCPVEDTIRGTVVS